MERFLQPELLDVLASHDPRARRSRRDLRRINAWMGNARLAASFLAQAARRAPPRRILDLGAGDGTFLLCLVRHLPILPSGTELVLLDRQNTVDGEVLAALRARQFVPVVQQADAWEWLRAMPRQSGTWVLANLFLHHFTGDELGAAFGLLAERTDLCFSCDPRRALRTLGAARLLRFIGANAVTRHDASVSVQAGFSGKELSGLWPVNGCWRLREGRAGLFSHHFLAERVTGFPHRGS